MRNRQSSSAVCSARLPPLPEPDTKSLIAARRQDILFRVPTSAMAISSRAATYAALIFPSTAATALPSNVSVNRRAQRQRGKAVAAVARASSGGTVLDRPAFDQSQLDTLPVTQEGGDTGRLKDRRGSGSGDSYKVLLVDDARHTDKLVEKALPQVVPSITAEAARELFHESRQKGAALVVVAVKEHAEFYAQMMVRQGLRSAIEPESDMAS